MPAHIVESQATGEEVEAIITERLLPAVHDLGRTEVLLSLIVLTLTLMKPNITSEEVVEGVKGVSQWMCLFLSEPEVKSGEQKLN